MNVRKARGAMFVASSAFSAVGAARQVTKARQERDGLLLVNALANVLVVITGIALAYRAFKNKGAS
jgi:hypothetical protein